MRLEIEHYGIECKIQLKEDANIEEVMFAIRAMLMAAGYHPNSIAEYLTLE